jgi:hypothetical protein
MEKPGWFSRFFLVKNREKPDQNGEKTWQNLGFCGKKTAFFG